MVNWERICADCIEEKPREVKTIAIRGPFRCPECGENRDEVTGLAVRWCSAEKAEKVEEEIGEEAE
jgi:transcription initiation factor IIE alpha subunit